MAILITRRATALALSAVALAGCGMFATAATAGATAAAGEMSIASPAANVPSGCITWRDSRGPGGGDRRHAQCKGMDVLVTIFCNTGTSIGADFRRDYGKAECPGYGGRERDFQIVVRR